jgi:hypothetical protein
VSDQQRNTEVRAAGLMMELAEQNEFFSMLFPHKVAKFKPGESFLALSEDKRELLKNLKSDDLRKVRWPRWTS